MLGKLHKLYPLNNPIEAYKVDSMMDLNYDVEHMYWSQVATGDNHS